HPQLRRFIAGSNRTSLERLLVTQDGLHAIMHTLVHDGALHDLDNRHVPGNMPVLGHEFQGAVIARQALTSPWAPPWAANKTLPFKAKQGQRITIKDGVTYLGIIPLPATDLGRSDEVVLREGEEQTFEKMKFRPALVIDSFNLQRDSAGAAPSAAAYQNFQKS